MTMTAPPNTPGSQRAVPRHPLPRTVTRLRELLGGKRWVLRPSWSDYLAGGDEPLVPIDHLTRDQRVAARSWLQQQRHALYRALEGGERAPDGWLEDMPLYQSLEGDLGRR